MFNSNDNGMVMPVAPMYGGGFGGGYGNNGSFLGGDGIWAILLFALLFNNGGWGGFGGYGGAAGAAIADGAMLYPWMNQVETTTDGFQNLATQNQITAVQSDLGDIQTQLCNGFGNVQNSLCNGFAGVNQTVQNGFAQAEISDNARQIANMQQAFNAQTAVTAGINDLSAQFANCCCENRLATQALNSTIISENCADREALNNGVRDILTNQNAGIQRILDTMCQDKIDAKNERIADLQNQLTMANLAASQTAQTARLLADNAAQTQALEQYLNPVPIPSYTVQNPNCCANWNSCGCGCGA